MVKTKFKIGDRVKIKSLGDPTDGKIGTIVKKYADALWTVKIPGFQGHDGGVFDGTIDKWNLLESELRKLPLEKESMKIEASREGSKEIVYPCFRKSINGNELIVLFFSEIKGIVVDPGTQTYWNAGQYYDNWCNFSKTPLENYSATISSEP